MTETKQTRPHILLFIPDQWRGDVLGHLGNPAAVTPNLDRLVNQDAVSFSRAFSQNPVCPSDTHTHPSHITKYSNQI